ncbi:hypothetical protein L7F22_007319 [Adiantum nelumboides]|nr:hypothetical protein [Adiantum nelumboides]
MIPKDPGGQVCIEQSNGQLMTRNIGSQRSTEELGDRSQRNPDVQEQMKIPSLDNSQETTLKKEDTFSWDTKCQGGFENIKELFPRNLVDFPIYFGNKRSSQAEDSNFLVLNWLISGLFRFRFVSGSGLLVSSSGSGLASRSGSLVSLVTGLASRGLLSLVLDRSSSLVSLVTGQSLVQDWLADLVHCSLVILVTGSGLASRGLLSLVLDRSGSLVSFHNYEIHEPLEERVFRHAIEENYFNSGKFDAVLSGEQVTALLALYRSQHDWQNLHSINHPFAREPSWPPHTNYDGDKLTSIHNGKAMLSCRGTNRKYFKMYQPGIHRSSAYITGANAVPLNLRKKKVPSEGLPSEEQLRLDLKHNVAASSLNESTGAVHDSKKPSVDVIEGVKSYCGRALEDGEFVAPTFTTDSSSSNEVFGRVQSESADSDSAAKDVKTRNFIEMLENNLPSLSHNNSMLSNCSQRAAMLPSNDDDGDDKAESPAKGKAIQINNSIYGQNKLVQKDTQLAMPSAECSRKRTRGIPFAPGRLFSDHEEKVKQSVWLRLSDPRPKGEDGNMETAAGRTNCKRILQHV